MYTLCIYKYICISFVYNPHCPPLITLRRLNIGFDKQVELFKYTHNFVQTGPHRCCQVYFMLSVPYVESNFAISMYMKYF